MLNNKHRVKDDNLAVSTTKHSRYSKQDDDFKGLYANVASRPHFHKNSQCNEST